MKYLSSFKKIKALTQELALSKLENEGLKREMKTMEEPQKQVVNYQIFKQMKEELMKKDKEIEDLKREINEMKMKELEFKFTESYLEKIEQENQDLKTKIKNLSEEMPSIEDNYLQNSPKTKSLPLLSFSFSYSSSSSPPSESSSLTSQYEMQMESIKKKFSTQGFESKKMITDNEVKKK